MRSLLPLALLVGSSTLACSDPAAPIAQVGAQYRTFTPTGSGSSCPSGWGGIGATQPLTEGGRVGVPEMPKLNGYPTNPGGPVVDGQEGPRAEGPLYEVECSVIGEDGVDLSASLSGQNASPSGDGTTRTSISARAKIDGNGKGTGTVNFFTTASGPVAPASDSECTFEVVPNGQGELQVGPGHIWTTFRCPRLRVNSQDSNCAAEGTLVLKDCTKN